MNTKQIIEKLQACKTGEQFFELQKEFTQSGLKGNLSFDFEENRAYILRDLRSDIKSKLNSEKISIRQLSIAVNIDYSSLKQYLLGTRQIPLQILQRILGLLNI